MKVSPEVVRAVAQKMLATAEETGSDVRTIVRACAGLEVRRRIGAIVVKRMNASSGAAMGDGVPGQKVSDV